MKATEFSQYFEFTLDKIPFSEVPEDERDDFPEGTEYVYCATDDQGTFATRYFDNISLITEQFNSCLTDYVERTIEEDGFMYLGSSPSEIYEPLHNLIQLIRREGLSKENMEELTNLAEQVKIALQAYDQGARTYYQFALAWCDASDDYRNTDTRDIIQCLVDPKYIEDDTVTPERREIA